VNIPSGHWSSEYLKAISIEAWIKVKSCAEMADASLVISITNLMNDVVVLKTISLQGDKIAMETWFKASTTLETGNYIYTAGDRIRIYLWNEGCSDVLIDDLTVIFGEQTLPGKNVNPSWAPGSASVNTPPYRPIFLVPEDIGNNDRLSFTAQHREIPDDARFFTGSYCNPNRSLTEILVAFPGHIDQYYWEPAEREFAHREFGVPKLTKNILENSNIQSGDLDGNGLDELLIISNADDSISLISFDGTIGKVDWKKVAFPEKKQYKNLILFDAIQGGPFELLAIRADGNWDLLHLQNNTWIKFSSSNGGVTFPNQQHGALIIYPLSFHGSGAYLLCTYFPKSRSKSSYRVYQFDPQQKAPVSSIKVLNGMGLFLGTDTLSMNDQYRSCGQAADGTPLFLRERNDWRYDLKLIQFTDSTYSILGSIDFETDQEGINPKYYERLDLMTGCFLKPNEWSLLLIGRKGKNDQKAGALSESVRIYRFPIPDQK
jgi:hypothetical protein